MPMTERGWRCPCGSIPKIGKTCESCKARNRAKGARWRLALKRAVMDAYGGVCGCCGETEMLFLTVDHVNGGGIKHRTEVKQNGNAFYSWLRNRGFPRGYQVMCFNCNFGRWANGGRCPHEGIKAR